MFKFEQKALEDFLANQRFPASKEQVLEKAQSAELPHQILLLMQRLDDRQYGSAEDVEKDLAAHKA